jgi:hypothetical protein
VLASGLLAAAIDGCLDPLRVPPDARALDAIPGAVAGVHLALAVALARGWLAGPDAHAARGILRASSRDAGTCGDALARRRIATLLGHAATGDAAIGDTPAVDDANAWTLLARGEHALATDDLDAARAVADALCAARERTGRWLGAVRAADHHLPCAVLGTGAVAHLLARVANPSTVGASLRVLA